jgi:hypothetical protein
MKSVASSVNLTEWVSFLFRLCYVCDQFVSVNNILILNMFRI